MIPRVKRIMFDFDVHGCSSTSAAIFSLVFAIMKCHIIIFKIMRVQIWVMRGRNEYFIEDDCPATVHVYLSWYRFSAWIRPSYVLPCTC